MRHLTTIALTLALLIVGLSFTSTASAHTITRTACAQAAHRDMVTNPPHTTTQRKVTFRRCLSYAATHTVVHKLAQCSTLRQGTNHTRWTVRAACKIMVVWPHNYSDREAVTVAWCEGTLSPSAENGQYKGTFQMGTGERARWGHGSTLAAQTSAAADYYEYDRDVTGRGGWGPWSCKPGSVDNRRAWGRAPSALIRYVY